MEEWPWDSLYQGVVLGFNAGIMPGPLLALTITATVTQGLSSGIKVALAPLITDLPIMAVAGWVLLCCSIPDIFLGIFFMLSAMGIVWLAWQSFHRLPGGIHPQERGLATVRTAIVVNLFNPYPYLFWIGIGFPVALRSARSSFGAVFVFVASFYCLLVGTKMAVAFLMSIAGYDRVNVMTAKLNIVTSGLLLASAGWMLYDGWTIMP